MKHWPCSVMLKHLYCARPGQCENNSRFESTVLSTDWRHGFILNRSIVHLSVSVVPPPPPPGPSKLKVSNCWLERYAVTAFLLCVAVHLDNLVFFAYLLVSPPLYQVLTITLPRPNPFRRIRCIFTVLSEEIDGSHYVINLNVLMLPAFSG